MDRAEKIDCRSNGEVIFTGATTKFQLKKGLTLARKVHCTRRCAKKYFEVISQLKKMINTIRNKIRSIINRDVNSFSPTHRRFINVNREDYVLYIDAAKKYVNNLDNELKDYLFMKPYDNSNKNDKYFELMFNILSLLARMNVKRGNRVLEVGCGPGWITEMLVCLGYNVDAIEPNEEFIEIAKKRVLSARAHHHNNDNAKIRFICSTIEEFSSNAESYDAIIFFDVLHHVVDEEKAFEKCFTLLAKGGSIGIHEGAWQADNKKLKEELSNEMKKYHTLENPFSAEYMDYLFKKYGFVNIQRCSQINGLFPKEIENSPIKQYAQLKSDSNNIIIARKPAGVPTTLDSDAITKAEIKIISQMYYPENQSIVFTVDLHNTGETVWLSDQSLLRGFVTISLFCGELGKDAREAGRILLSNDVLPDKHIVMDLKYYISKCDLDKQWKIDLINEGYFWFSKKGTMLKEVSIK